jgi:post-segregation antitoxin (ccd killing protein)
MNALNIRDIGDDRKAALEAEARAHGISVAELVRRFLDEGLRRARSERAREAWLAEAREGLAFEAEHFARHGPTLARYRRLSGAGEGA